MNQKDERVRFRKRIDAELSDLNGDPYLADKVLALAQPEKQYSKAKRPAYRLAYLKLALVTAALVLLTVSLLLWHTQPQNDFVTRFCTKKSISHLKKNYMSDPVYSVSTAETDIFLTKATCIWLSKTARKFWSVLT